MKIIVDTNIFLAVVLDAPERAQIIKLTIGNDLIAPEVLPYEIGNTLTAMMKKRQLSADNITKIWDILQDIPVELYKTNIRAALKIASKYNIYAYDAYFLECAVNLQCPFLSLDKRLKLIAQETGISILE